jgi:3-phosphoshikimate 1-carboxyvinyltransferase
VRVARIAPGQAPAQWSLRVPGSKSLTNRALLVAALASGGSLVSGGLLADDTEAMLVALRALGARVEPVSNSAVAPESWRIEGLGGAPRGNAAVDCGMAGTVARFLLPAIAAGEGSFSVDGHPQLRRRPLGPLVAALRAQGAAIDSDSLPLTVTASGLAGGELSVDTTVSSQFLSGLMLAAPLARTGMRLRFESLVSRPYLELTAAVMSAFGVNAELGEHSVAIAPGGYRAVAYEVEPDASTASYFLAAAALTGTSVTLGGLDRETSRQGDLELVDFLVAMGAQAPAASSQAPPEHEPVALEHAPALSSAALTLRGPASLRGVRANMRDSSDVFMTLACVAPFADTPTTIEGIGHVRAKESDRLAATAENLRRLGISVQEGADSLTVEPGQPRPARLPTYDDHRIAMAFALIGLRVPVELEQPEVVAKTCPPFFELWRQTGANVRIDETDATGDGDDVDEGA